MLLTNLVAAMPGSTEGGIIYFFLQAGPTAKIVLSILTGFSVLSWAIMIRKYLLARRVGAQNRLFLDAFRRSARFSEINAVAGQFGSSPLVGLFQAGYLEIDTQVKALAEQGQSGTRYKVKSLSGIERSLKRAIGVELQSLSRQGQILATTAAATPFIGLFGTVAGIMVAFNDIGATGTASIVAVAPGIAEALVNTAAGLVAAIPALIGYNQLANWLRQTRVELEDFALEFLNLAERNFT